MKNNTIRMGESRSFASQPRPFSFWSRIRRHSKRTVTTDGRIHAPALYHHLLQAHHYLGAGSMAGARLRYLARSGGEIVGALGFGASSWLVAGGDRFIGWSGSSRRANLHFLRRSSCELNWAFSPDRICKPCTQFPKTVLKSYLTLLTKSQSDPSIIDAKIIEKEALQIPDTQQAVLVDRVFDYLSQRPAPPLKES